MPPGRHLRRFTGGLENGLIPALKQIDPFVFDNRRGVGWRGSLEATSADRLNSGWTAARRARTRGNRQATSQIERLMADVPREATLITVTDGHPATLAWIGAVMGHQTTPLGVEHFGQTGTVSDLYRHFMIDADAIVAGANHHSAGRTIRQSRRILA